MNDLKPARMSPPPLPMLVALAALQPMAVNILVPATPKIARELSASYGTVQLTLSLYLVAVALVQLFTGPLSDKRGRKPVILGALALFVTGCVVAIFAQSIEMLLAARVLQGFGSGTAFTLVRTIIRDTSERDEAASRIGYLMVAMLVIPMISPTVGSAIDARFDWHGIFIFMALVGLIVLPVTWRFLRETNPGGGAHGKPLLAEIPVFLRSRRFVGYTLAVCMPSGLFFSFLAGAPHVVINVMGASPQELGYWFACLASGYMLGNLGSGRFAQRHGADRLLLIGSLLALTGTAVQFALSFLTPWTPAMIYIPAILVSAGNGLAIPCGTAAALSVRPEAAGAASGLAGATQLGFGAFLSFVMARAVEVWPQSLVAIMFACSVGGVLAQLLLRTEASPSAR